jgi:hypothetical protein
LTVVEKKRRVQMIQRKLVRAAEDCAWLGGIMRARIAETGAAFKRGNPTLHQAKFSAMMSQLC